MIIEPSEMKSYLEENGGFPKSAIEKFFLEHIEEGESFLDNLREGDNYYLIVEEINNENSFSIYNISDDDIHLLNIEGIVATDAIRLLKEIIAH